MLLDRKFIIMAVYGIGAVVTGVAWMVKLLEEHTYIQDAIPEALERAVLWPIFLIGALFS